MEDKNKIEKLNKEIENISEEITDHVEDLKYLLDTVEIEKINLMQFHYIIYDLIIRKNQLEQIKFNYEF